MRVPTVSGPSVEERPLQTPYQRSSATPDLLGAPGRQTQALGEAVFGLGTAMERERKKEEIELAETRAKDADTQFSQALSELQYHPESGYMGRQGRAAAESYGDAVQSAQSLQRRVLDTISDPRARNLASPALEARTTAAVQAMSRHAAAEGHKWKVQSSQSRAETTLLNAANDPTDPQLFASALNAAHAEADAQGELQGWDTETTELRKRTYSDFAYERRYVAWAAKDPVGALAHFAQHGQAMTPMERQQTAQRLFQAAAPVLADELNAQGGAGVVPTAPVEPGKPATSAPRGLRNNNPGNIVRTDRHWQGEIIGNDARYATFETPEAGIRAMARTLQTYEQRHGLNSVQAIIARWAPASENETGSYIKAVSSALGVKPDQPLNLQDPATMSGLVRSIIKVENGQQPYTDAQIAGGIASAANAEGTPAALPPVPPAPPGLRDPTSTPTGHALIDMLPPNQRLQVIQMARARGAQAMAESREQLRERVQDAQAEFMANGTASSPPPEAEFIRAYGQHEGVKRYREFQDVGQLGRQVQEVRNLTSPQLEKLLQQAKPVPGEGFALQQRNYEVLTRAAQHTIEQRQKDPIAYAAQSGMYGIKPLARLDPQALATELPRRAGAAEKIATDYGTPVSLLTVPEGRALAAQLKAAPVEGQKQQLGALSASVRDVNLYKRLMQAVAPDAPVIAMAGIYQARGLRSTDRRDVADLLLRGQAILSPNTKTDGSGHQGGRSLVAMPEEKLLQSDFNAAAGDAFKGKEQAADAFYQAAKAVYAARSAEEGDYSGIVDSKRWKAAIRLATGGIEAHNGARIVLPYGMGYDVFQGALPERVAEAVKLAPPVNASAADLLGLPLENFGDGRYYFRRGAGYVVDKNGRPLEVDVNPRTVRPESSW